MGRARVLLVEDHRQMAEQLRKVLETEFDVVATVSDGYSLLGAVRVLKPDIVVTDIVMPGLDGLHAAELLLQDDPAAKIVVITVEDDPALYKRSMDVGVLAYVVKFQGCNDLLDAVRAAARGERHPK